MAPSPFARRNAYADAGGAKCADSDSARTVARTTSSASLLARARMQPSWSYSETCRMPASAAQTSTRAMSARHRDDEASSGSFTMTASVRGGGGRSPWSAQGVLNDPTSNARRSLRAQNARPRLGSRNASPETRNARSTAALPADRVHRNTWSTTHSARATNHDADDTADARRARAARSIARVERKRRRVPWPTLDAASPSRERG